MNVAEAVGTTLAGLGVRQVFGVVGSGNFHVPNALVDAGARYVAARHEAGAATMADAYARMSGEVPAVTLHQGCGLTNAMTGVTEAAKSRTPLLVIAAQATSTESNFFVDQPGLARAVGAESIRVASASSARAEVVRAYQLARDDRRTVVLNLPLDVQAAVLADEPPQDTPAPPAPLPTSPAPADVDALVELLAGAERPVLLAGRGARHARAELLDLADACGALLATSAVVRGLFNASPWSLDVSGGFASPVAAELIRGADVIAAFGCALTMWTTRHGRLIGPDTKVAQADIEPAAIGRHHPVHLGVAGDSAAVAGAAADALRSAGRERRGYRTETVSHRLARELRWRDVPYDDWGGGGQSARIDPRTFTIALDDLLPVQRVVAVDSGNFMGYPSMYLSVPDEFGFCFTQAFQSIGLGLATAVGAALAQPDRLPVAAVGDGGVLMAAAELDTVRRLGLPMIVVVYDDAAYGAEVHHFGPGARLSTVTFPDTDIAAIGSGYGFEGLIVRAPADLDGVRRWLHGPRDRPLLVDAKVAAPRGSWWLEEAFRGH